MARAKTIINKFGKLAGWNSITANMMGRDLEGITELSYDDSVEKENAYGAGMYPVGRGEGNYTAKASVTLLLEERIALQRSLPPGSRIQDIAPFDINVQYAYDGFLYRDRILNCEFTGNAVEVKQNDKTIAYKYELIVSHIDWNVA
ncbi:MAG: hypothetical protein LBL24_07480 [Bacteroidales bacterium]|jgi:hypothetical protein|nr:hypothetical protein [Bacteroidales bacterium]